MKQKLVAIITAACKELFNVEPAVSVTRPDEQFGDYATNVALQLAKDLHESPRSIAEKLIPVIQEHATDIIAEVSIAGPAFINIRLRDQALVDMQQFAPTQTLEGKIVVTEYSDPNPFKVLHAGHLYTTLVGDAISRLLEAAGAEVHRVNFGGDVGLHVAKSMWAILRSLGGELPEKLQTVGDDPHEHATWLSARYVEGNTAYETNEVAKAEIIAVNKRVYQLHADADHDSAFAQIYWTCRDWSYTYFKVLYEELEVKPFEKYYPESVTTPTGIATVQEQLARGVYEKSDGAVIFDGEKYGLHTRVFINSHGLPTYEAKDVGLIIQKWEDYHFDTSIVITANDIVEYMKVVQKSIEQFNPELAKRSIHLTHGNLKLQGGAKMSSRKGNVLLALDVLAEARTANHTMTGQDNEETVLGAVKYAFLKQRIGGDVVYDPKESVSLEGNSGPYLQYAHARAQSILRKAGTFQPDLAVLVDLEPDERSLLRKLSEYSEAIDEAVKDCMPHHVCTYLYTLAQSFNQFYEHNRVVGDAREATRLALVTRYTQVLAAGLGLLGIVAPDSM
jgi:arginyl-tRNA synthetase